MRLFLSLLTLAVAQATSTNYVRKTQIDDTTDQWQGIVGGSAAGENEFPWFAAFVPLVQCGGSLIAPNRVLTAAHCVVNGAPTSVRVGATTTSNGVELGVQCGQYHPDYRVGTQGDLFNDLAVLKLSESTDITPIGLNSDVNFPNTEGEPLRVIGFGATSQGGSVSNVLKKLDTAFFNINTCQQNYPDVEFGTHVCGNVDNEGDCQGDSGGPLFHNNTLQVGIVSYGIGCAQPSEDVYAGVAKYHAWIQDQINNDECNVDPGGFCCFDLLVAGFKALGNLGNFIARAFS